MATASTPVRHIIGIGVPSRRAFNKVIIMLYLYIYNSKS